MDWTYLELDSAPEHKDGELKRSTKAQSEGLPAQSLAHWGSTSVTGRGLLALSGKGQIHQITLKTGESYVVHPSNLIAYAMMQNPPQPYRFKSNLLRFQVPSMTAWLPDTRFWRTMRESTAWNFIRNSAFVLRTWARKTIWGDRVRQSKSELELGFQLTTTSALPSISRSSQPVDTVSRLIAH